MYVSCESPSDTTFSYMSDRFRLVGTEGCGLFAADGSPGGVLGGQELLSLADGLIADDRLVDDLLGEDPFVLVVTASARWPTPPEAQ